MQLDYPTSQARGLVGELASIGPYKARARVYANQTHQVDVTMTGNTDGERTITISTPTGRLPLAAVTAPYTAAADSTAAIAAALASAINSAGVEVNGVTTYPLSNVVRATANGTAVEIRAVRSGEEFTVTLGGAQSGEMSQTTSSNAVVSGIPYAIAMVDVDGDNARVPQTGDTDAAILGFTKRGKQLEAADDGSGELHDAGDSLEIVHETSGDGLYLMPEDDLAVNGAVFVRLTATGNEQAGAVRSDADGGDAIAVTGVRVTRASDVANGVPACIALARP